MPIFSRKFQRLPSSLSPPFLPPPSLLPLPPTMPVSHEVERHTEYGQDVDKIPVFAVPDRLKGAEGRPKPFIGPDVKAYLEEWKKSVGENSDEWWAKVSVRVEAIPRGVKGGRQRASTRRLLGGGSTQRGQAGKSFAALQQNLLLRPYETLNRRTKELRHGNGQSEYTRSPHWSSLASEQPNWSEAERGATLLVASPPLPNMPCLDACRSRRLTQFTLFPPTASPHTSLPSPARYACPLIRSLRIFR